jgi:hypothetical protein
MGMAWSRPVLSSRTRLTAEAALRTSSTPRIRFSESCSATRGPKTPGVNVLSDRKPMVSRFPSSPNRSLKARYSRYLGWSIGMARENS